MQKNKLLSVIVISFVFIMFSGMPCFASVAELQSQLASIQSQIASINAQIAQLQSQLGQLQGEDGSGSGEGADDQDPSDGDDEGDGDHDEYGDDHDEYGDDYDDDIYYDEDGNPYTGDEIDQMIDDGVFDEGNLPDWALDLDDREQHDFPDDASQMTGGGVYTSRGTGDGQKITDWNSDPMGTDINERTRDDSDYGPTEGEDDGHSDKDDWAGGEWKDEDPSSSGEESYPSSGGRSSGGEDHPHDANGQDASSGGGGMLGFLGNMFAEPLVQTGAAIGEAVTSPIQDGSVTPDSANTSGTDGTRDPFAGMNPEALERLQRHGEALSLGMGTGSGSSSTGSSSAGTMRTEGNLFNDGADFNDNMVTTPASAADASLYGGANLPDTNRGDMSPASSSNASSISQAASTAASQPQANTSSNTTKPSTGWSPPSRIGAGTTSKDPHILPGNQNVMAGSRSSMGVGQDAMGGGKDVMRGGNDVMALNKDQIMGAKNSLIKVQRALDDALHNGDISINQYNRAMQGVKQSRNYLDVAASSAGSISNAEVEAMSNDISSQITNVRRMIDASDSSAAGVALDKYETMVHEAIAVERVEELAAAQDAIRQTRFVDTVDMISAGERQIMDAERGIAKDVTMQTRFVDNFAAVPADEGLVVKPQKVFVDSAEMLGVADEVQVAAARDALPVEGKPLIKVQEARMSEGRPVEALQRHEVFVKPIPAGYEGRLVEGKPIEALQRREEYVGVATEGRLEEMVEARPVTAAHLDRMVEGRPVMQPQEHRAIEVRPVMAEGKPVTQGHLEEMVESRPVQYQRDRVVGNIGEVDRLETLQEGELVRETLQEGPAQRNFWDGFWGVAQEEKEEEIRYVR